MRLVSACANRIDKGRALQNKSPQLRDARAQILGFRPSGACSGSCKGRTCVAEPLSWHPVPCSASGKRVALQNESPSNFGTRGPKSTYPAQQRWLGFLQGENVRGGALILASCSVQCLWQTSSFTERITFQLRDARAQIHVSGPTALARVPARGELAWRTHYLGILFRVVPLANVELDRMNCLNFGMRGPKFSDAGGGIARTC